MLLLAMFVHLPKVPAETGQNASSFSEFDAWWQSYVSAAAAERPALVKNGIALAKTRREAMKSLIETDPATAIQRAFAEEYRSALPEPIGELVELHVRALGQLTVTKSKNSATRRQVKIDQTTWNAYLYGPRLALSSRDEIPIHGVVLDGAMAVDGSPLERFPARESLLNVLSQSEGKKTCPICGEPGTIPGAVGDILMWFDSEEHLITCEKALIEKEANPEIGE